MSIFAHVRTLADILGATEPNIAGADGEMSRVDLERRPSLLFDTSETVGLEHIACRVDKSRFAEIVTRLRERGLPFGNHPEDTRNGRTDGQTTFWVAPPKSSS